MRFPLFAAFLLVAAGPAFAQAALSNSWSSSEFSMFPHVLEGPPGSHTLIIDARTDSPGGETVAVYPQTREGRRGSPRILTVIATRQGNSAEGTVRFPTPAAGESVTKVPIMVVVENASGRRYSGEYRLTLVP